MIDFIKVGERIAAHRKRLGMSQEELASRLYVTRQAVSKWEKGVSVPSLDLLSSLSTLFSVSFEEILGLFENIPTELDPQDVFKGHDRGYVITGIISGKIKVCIPDIFYQLSPAERMLILRKIREGELSCDRESLIPRLTPPEREYLTKND